MITVRIHLVTPAAPSSRLGNGVTAARWQALFSSLGHRVTWSKTWNGERFDVLVAMHARRSFPAIRAYRDAHPDAPLVIVLTGTDLYQDLPDDPHAQESLRLASRLVVLQSRGPDALPCAMRGKAHVIVQSAVSIPRTAPDAEMFEVSLLSHLRAVKDPLRPALATRLLPASSRIHVTHGGRALDPELEDEARTETASNPRYRWLGPLAAEQAGDLLARSRLLVLPSRLEGGANVACEAIAVGVPILASKVEGNIGLLGASYGGYYPVGDTAALAALLHRAESDPGFYRLLEQQVAAQQDLVAPARERAGWQELLLTLQPAALGR